MMAAANIAWAVWITYQDRTLYLMPSLNAGAWAWVLLSLIT
jgi:hypothetical protein